MSSTMGRERAVRALAWRCAGAVLVLAAAGCDSEVRRWEKAKGADTVDAYQQFLRDNPASAHKAEAEQALQERAWKQAVEAGTVEAFAAFAATYSGGQHATEAKARIAALDWRGAQQQDTVEAMRAFLAKHGDSAHAADARSRLEVLQTVVEVADLLYAKDDGARGTVTMRGAGACGVNYSGSWKADEGKLVTPPEDPASFRVVFVPGVRHSYTGKVCLPGVGLRYADQIKLRGQGRTHVTGNAYRMAYESAEFSGSATFSEADGAGKVFVVESGNTEPLMLEVTALGYRHVSGHGTLLTPEGRRYQFP